MAPVRISLVLLTMLSVSLAGNLEEKWFSDLKKAQESAVTGQSQSSSLNTAEFQTKKFNTTTFSDTKGNPLQQKVFATKEFNYGKTDNTWADKKFKTAPNSSFSRDNKAMGTGQIFATSTSSLSDDRLNEDKRAREDGMKAVLEREKSVLSDMRYQGPEVEKIGQEVKLINDTLKNKDDLKDHKISIEEIREILNKN